MGIIDRQCEEGYNFQGCLMKIIKYINANDIFVEFQDEYKAIVHGAYKEFKKGKIKNPYHPEVYGVGMIGQKYATSINGKSTKEYKIWHNIVKHQTLQYNPQLKDEVEEIESRTKRMRGSHEFYDYQYFTW